MPTRPSLRIALWLPNTRRRLAPFLLAALLPGLTGCGFSIARDVAYGGCIGLLWGFGVLPSGDKAADAKAAKQCVQSFFGKKLVTGEAGSTPPIGAAAAVTRTGEALLAAYGAEGRVQAAEFPRAVLAVPYQRLDLAGAGAVNVLVSTQILQDGFEPAGQTFQSMAVALRTAADGTVAEASAEFDGEAAAASVAFEGVQPRPGLEAVVTFAGAAVRDATLFLTAQASVPVAGAGTSSATASPADTSVTGSDPHSLEPSLPAPARSASRALKVRGPAEFVLAFSRARGSIKAKKVPKLVFDLPANGKARVDVDAGFGVMTEKFTAPKQAERPNSISVDLLTVKGSKTKKVAIKKANVDKDGNASVRFKKVDVPKNGHLRAVIKLQGKKVKNALIIAYGSAA